MAILIDEKKRVLVQGITGREGRAPGGRRSAQGRAPRPRGRWRPVLRGEPARGFIGVGRHDVLMAVGRENVELRQMVLDLLSSPAGRCVARYAQAPVPMGGAQAWILYFRSQSSSEN